MEDEISCDDPQFISMLEACLRVEIDAAKVVLSDLENEKKECRAQIRAYLRSRKDLNEETKITQENITVLMDALDKSDKYVKQITAKIELMKLNMDDDYKIMKMENNKYECIIRDCEKTWQLYYDKYEAFPLAKVRKEAKIELQKLEVNKMVLQFKIAECHKFLKLMQEIGWLRLRAKIVALAGQVSDRTKLEDKLRMINNNVKNTKDRLNKIEAKLAAELKREEEEKEARAIKILEMPPPKINLSHMRTIYERKPGSDYLDDWKRNCDNSMDTISVDTLMFEERCLGEESVVRRSSQTSFQGEEGEDHGDKGQPIDATSPPLQQQEQPEVEHEDASSEVDGNVCPGPIDAPEEEVEQRMDQELEHSKRLTGLSNDKQTAQHGGEEDLVKEMNDPPAKEMKLIYDMGKVVAPPRMIKRLDRSESRTSDANAGPSIRNIETVRYGASPLKKMRTSGLNAGSQWSSRISQAGKINQDNSNPSGAFPSRNYDYSDSSVMSFCLYNNMDDVKVDQLSLNEQSINDLCECSNLSEEAQMEPVLKSVENAQPTSKKNSFPSNCKDTYKRVTIDKILRSSYNREKQM